MARLPSDGTYEDSVVRRLTQAAQKSFGLLGKWATLAALGLAPTATAVAGFAVGVLTGSPTAALLAALVVASIAIGALSYALVRTHRLMKAHQRSTILVRELLESRRPTAGQWISNGDLATLNVAHVSVQRAVDDALRTARAQIATDASLTLDHFTLWPFPRISLRGISAMAAKTFYVMLTNDGAFVHHVRRADATDMVTHDPGDWLRDDSWRELVTQSWLVERPFRGEIELTFTRGSWQIEYRDYDPTTEMVGGTRRYRLVEGRAVRS